MTEHKFPTELLDLLEFQRIYANYSGPKFGKHFSQEGDSLLFSVLGLDADEEKRLQYANWSKQDGETERIVAALGKFPDYCVSVNVDRIKITPKIYFKNESFKPVDLSNISLENGNISIEEFKIRVEEVFNNPIVDIDTIEEK